MKPCKNLNKQTYVSIDMTASECVSCIFAALGNHDIEKTTHINVIPEGRSSDLVHYESFALRDSFSGPMAKISSGVELEDGTRTEDSTVYFRLDCLKV